MSNTWQLVSERSGGSVSWLLAHGEDVLALSAAAVHRSVDGGLSWSSLSAGQPSPPLYALARTERSLVVGGAGGLFRSRDEGQSWRHVLSGAAVTSLAVGADQSLLAGTDTDGILRSEDDGETWSSGNPGLLELSVLCLADGFAGTVTGLYRSVNGGRSWREVQLVQEQVAIECVCSSGRTAVAGTRTAGAFVSADAGRTWSAVPVRDASISAVAIDGLRVAFASPDAVYISHDGGQIWRREATQELVLSLAFVGPRLLAGVARNGVLQVDARRYASSGLNGRVVVDLVRTPGGALLTASIEDGVERSTDGGRTWRGVDGCGASPTRLAVGGDRLYAATSEGLYASADDGCHWSAVRSDGAAVAISATSTGQALAAFSGDQVFLRRDEEWAQLTWHHGRIVSVGLSRDGSLFVGCLAEAPLVWRSSDAGLSWSVWLRCTTGATLSLATCEDDVLAASGTSVYRVLGATLLPDHVTSITFGAPRRVYAATTGGVYVSTDGAQHFSPWSEDLPRLPVLALHASVHEVVALLFGGSLWRRQLPAPEGP